MKKKAEERMGPRHKSQGRKSQGVMATDDKAMNVTREPSQRFKSESNTTNTTLKKKSRVKEQD